MERVTTRKHQALILGVLTGLVGLVAMVRLVSGAFNDGLNGFAWGAILLAMAPWIGYCAWRAWHGNLTGRSLLVVSALGLVGLVCVWASTLGAVLALVCSLASFAVIWVHDWPPREARGEDRFVRIEELTADERD